MGNRQNAILSLQESANYKLAFEKVGFDRQNAQAINGYQKLLQQHKLPEIKPHQEKIITSLKIHADKGGLLSMVKHIAVSVNVVSLFWFATRHDNRVGFVCKEGLLLLTNIRMILAVHEPNSSTFKNVYNLFYDEINITDVDYDQDTLVLASPDSKERMLSFNFPKASPLLELGAIGLGNQTSSDHLSSMKSERYVQDYKDRGTNAKGLILQFFMRISELSRSSLTNQIQDNDSEDTLWEHSRFHAQI